MANLRTVSGDIVLVDEDDVPLLSDKRLYTLKTRKLTYATFVVRADGKQRSILVHRFLLDAPQGIMVDHRNGDGLDCRRENIRLATNALNQANRRADSESASGLKGVTKLGARRWNARIVIDGDTSGLGIYSKREDAARAYDRAALDAWGDYARLNFPSEVPPTRADCQALRIGVGQRGASRFRGVSWDEKHQKWLVKFVIDGRTVCPGRFADESTAARVHDLAVHDAGGGKERWNFPDEHPEQTRLQIESLIQDQERSIRGRSSYRGVSWYDGGQCWRAVIQVARKQRFLGRYDCQEDAARAYDRAALDAWGAGALPHLNFPDESGV